MSRGVEFIFAPAKEKVLASCGVPDCGCCWVNLLFGWLRLPIPRRTDGGKWIVSYCWGWWLSNRLAGACFRAWKVESGGEEQPIGYRCKHSGKITYYSEA